MNEAQVPSAANGAILFNAALAAAPTDAWFERAHWESLGRVEAGSAGRGGVAFVETPVGACALRPYRRGGLAARVSADHYLWAGAARTRAFREFRLLARLLEQGLPVPVPVAARYRREGWRYRADLLTRRIQPARTLAQTLAAGEANAALAQRVGGTLARFHAAGVWHADLNAHNILVDAGGAVWLLDFDRGRVRAPAVVWQQANLRRLRRSLDKLGANGSPGFDVNFWHPLLAAYHAAMANTNAGHAPSGVAS